MDTLLDTYLSTFSPSKLYINTYCNNKQMWLSINCLLLQYNRIKLYVTYTTPNTCLVCVLFPQARLDTCNISTRLLITRQCKQLHFVLCVHLCFLSNCKCVNNIVNILALVVKEILKAFHSFKFRSYVLI